MLELDDIKLAPKSTVTIYSLLLNMSFTILIGLKVLAQTFLLLNK